MAAKKKSTSSCQCMDKADKVLAERNGRLVRTIPFMKGAVSQPFIEIQKLDDQKREKPPRLVASHCPFCGQEYTADLSGSVVSEPKPKRSSKKRK